MAKTYKEMFDYEYGRLKGDRNAQNMFFGKAIAIQNSDRTYKIGYADMKFEFACDVLCNCGYCNHTMCDQCKLEAAHNKARKEIFEGLRNPNLKKKHEIESFDLVSSVATYLCKKYVDKTGHVTYVVREKNNIKSKDE